MHAEITVVIGLGSNLNSPLGDREQHLRLAIDAIIQPEGCRLNKTSAIYETEPWPTGSDQPWYLNMVIEITTTETIKAFHQRCQQIEHNLGRPDTRKTNTSRTIDIDLLWAVNTTSQEPIIANTEALTLPHPRFHTRACTLVPLLEHYAHWQHTVHKQTLNNFHQALQDTSEIRLYTMLDVNSNVIKSS
jgi:2-amino-4-hydroxy-6-hydroxymethyldihydropteridine diphosphokinase